MRQYAECEPGAARIRRGFRMVMMRQGGDLLLLFGYVGLVAPALGVVIS